MKLIFQKISKSAILAFCISALCPTLGHAASIFFENSTFQVRSSSGTRLTNTTDNLAAYGWFTSGFTPTTSNVASWMNNFYGVSGYHRYNSTTLENTVSAGITLAFDTGPLHSPDDGVNDYLAKMAPSQGGSFLGSANVGTMLPENVAFSMILWNAPTIAAATEAAIFSSTGANWKITTQFDVDEPNIVELGGQTTLASVVGGELSTVTGNRFITMAVIPEPSSISLMITGLSAVFAFRRKALAKKR